VKRGAFDHDAQVAVSTYELNVAIESGLVTEAATGVPSFTPDEDDRDHGQASL
jgi:hypothetical protein